jgi:hypothetical protein
VRALQRRAGNQAVVRWVSPEPVVQRTPSHLRAILADNSNMKLSRLANLWPTSWDRYVRAVSMYYTLDDADRAGQLEIFPSTYATAVALAGGRKFNEREQADANWINRLLEAEKIELGHGRLAPQSGLTVEDDPELDVGEGYVDADRAGFQALFPVRPSLDQVLQGGLGDCYLLASVSSIVQRNPQHFVDHMVDNLDGTVTVMLYSAVDEPHPVVVRKSFPGERFARETLWVKILEKAYVASGLWRRPPPEPRIAAASESSSTSTSTSSTSVSEWSATGEPETEQPPLGRPRYTDIQGGSSEPALLHLTGKRTEGGGIGRQKGFFGLKMSGALMAVVAELRKDIEAAQEAKEDETVRALAAQWVALSKPSTDLDVMMQLLYTSRGAAEAFFKEHPDDAVIQGTLKDLGLTVADLFPGELGSGVYGIDDREAFARVQAAVDQGRPITASTKQVISDTENPAEETRGLAGEAKVAGLAANHAYSVLDYKPKSPGPGERIMIQLRNPWGHYGRTYEQAEGGLRGVADEQAGTFWIDLADLVAYFGEIAAIA